MDRKFYLCLLLILCGTITVPGASPGHQQEEVKRLWCELHPSRYCEAPMECRAQGNYLCPTYGSCGSGTICCCICKRPEHSEPSQWHTMMA